MEAKKVEVNYSKPIKQSYSSDIKESRLEELKDLLYEFFDDYTYENSKFAIFHLRKFKDKIYLYVSMENGPKSSGILNKLVTWKDSGENSTLEKGHQGGGNCRFIYGHHSDKATLQSMINEDSFIKLETNPDQIYELSNDPSYSEGDFQKLIDRNCIKWCNHPLDYEEEGSWFEKYRKEIKDETNLTINYLIRFNLTSVNDEYNDKKKWEYLKIRMKNYKIAIYFKNELLGEKEFIEYEKLDFVGLNDKTPDTEKELELLIDNENEYYIRYGGHIRDINNHEITFNENMKINAILNCHQIDKTHLSNEIKKLNKISKGFRHYTNEDFYGPWIIMNDKTTNDLPIPGIFQPSKQYPGGGNSQFRMIVKPVCDNNELDSFIVTYTIKAKTTFRDINKAKKIMRVAQNIYADLPPTPKKGEKKKPKPRKKDVKLKSKGVFYLGYHGFGLWKIGIVETQERKYIRDKENYEDSIDKMQEFCQEGIDAISNRNNIELQKNFTIYLHIERENPEVLEQNVKVELQKDDSDEIELFEKQNGNGIREYFKCNNHDYIVQYLIPIIKRINTDN